MKNKYKCTLAIVDIIETETEDEAYRMFTEIINKKSYDEMIVEEIFN